jgi:hypothetical protein
MASIAAATTELEALEKSQKEGAVLTAEEDLDAVLKSLETGSDGDPLKKSGDNDADNRGGKSDNDEDNEGGDPEETEMEKSVRLAAEAELAAENLRKSQEADGLDELIRASEAYEAMTETVKKSHGHIAEQMESMSKSMSSAMNLLVKMAGVIAVQSQEMAEMKKSRAEDMDTLKKSMETLGAKPVVPNKAVLGLGEHQHREEPLEKSVSEVNELLIKSVKEGKVDARYIGIYSTYKSVDFLPEDVRKAIGV